MPYQQSCNISLKQDLLQTSAIFRQLDILSRHANTYFHVSYPCHQHQT